MKARRRALRKHLVRAVGVVVGVYVLYVALGNAFLASRWGRSCFDAIDPEHVHFEYESATTFWFGRIHAKRLLVRGTDSSVDWRIVVDDAEATLSPAGFFSRTIRMHGARARGVEVRVRFKVDAADAHAERVQYLPPIRGLPDPPVRPAIMPPEPTDDDYRLWTVDLRDVDASEIREVWVEEVRVTGIGGWVRGGFTLKPLRHVEVTPTSVHFDDADLVAGGVPIAEHVRGDTDVTLREIDPRSIGPRDLIHRIDAKANLRGELLGLRVVNPSLAPFGVAVRGGGGPVALSATMERGTLAPGSELALHARGFTAALGPAATTAISGDALVDVAVTHAPKPQVVLHVDASGLVLWHRTTALARAAFVSLLGTMDDPDLGAPQPAWAASIDAPETELPDLRLLATYPGLPAFSGGSATAKLHADVAHQRMNARAHLALVDPALRIGKKLVHARSVTFDAKAIGFDLDRGAGALDTLKVAVDGADVDDETGFWLRANGTPARLGLPGSPTLVTTLTGELANATFPLALAGVPHAVGRAVAGGRVVVVGDLTASPGVVDLRDLRVAGDDLTLRAHYHGDRVHVRGAGLVESKLPNVGFTVDDEGVGVRPLASEAWYRTTMK